MFIVSEVIGSLTISHLLFQNGKKLGKVTTKNQQQQMLVRLVTNKQQLIRVKCGLGYIDTRIYRNTGPDCSVHRAQCDVKLEISLRRTKRVLWLELVLEGLLFVTM